MQRDLSANELDWIVGQSTHSPPGLPLPIVLRGCSPVICQKPKRWIEAYGCCMSWLKDRVIAQRPIWMRSYPMLKSHRWAGVSCFGSIPKNSMQSWKATWNNWIRALPLIAKSNIPKSPPSPICPMAVGIPVRGIRRSRVAKAAGAFACLRIYLVPNRLCPRVPHRRRPDRETESCTGLRARRRSELARTPSSHGP